MHKIVWISLTFVISASIYLATIPSTSLFTQANQCINDNQKIAYVSDDAVDQSDIYVVDMSGTNRSNLTQSSSLNDSPNWSPDGSQIAFISNRDGNWQIYKMDQDGSHVKNLTNEKSYDTNPSWSPDGRHIAFASNRDNPNGLNAQIYIMNSDGSDLVNVSNNAFQNYFPVWSPDSKQIAFISNDGKNAKIVLADLTNKTTRFLDVTADVNGLSWSSDGKHLAFEARIDEKNKIYTINSDGTNLNKLTDESINDSQPRWSPIGSDILFWTDRDKNLEIYIMDSEGNNVRNLTSNSSRDSGGMWSPTGEHIVFQSGREKNGNALYVMDSTGKNPHRIADQVLRFAYAWQPCLKVVPN
jgi:Tol biopolymer transport system component